ncbi:GNAT family N-acetyltransferase, partial [uncultured Actinomyces sp.]
MSATTPVRDDRPAGAATGWRTVLRPARPADARVVAELVRPYSERRILIAKDLIAYFEDIQEFTVAESAGAPDGPGSEDVGTIIGCGALHVMWDDIAEVRTLAVRKDYLHRGVGSAILTELLERARALGLRRVFCLTF